MREKLFNKASALSYLRLRIVLARKLPNFRDRKYLSIRNTKVLTIVKISALWRRTTLNLNIDRERVSNCVNSSKYLTHLYPEKQSARAQQLAVALRTLLIGQIWAQILKRIYAIRQ